MESSMASISCLPMEIMDKIIECNVISYVELCRLSCASRIFHCSTNSNRIWRIKFEQMWPGLADLVNDKNRDWKYQFRQRLNMKAMIQAWLKKLPEYFYSESDTSVFQSIGNIYQCHFSGWTIIQEELLSIINNPDKCQNLALQYCAKRAFWGLTRDHFNEDWRSFMSKNPLNNQILFHGACIISVLLRPTYFNCIKKSNSRIDALCEKVLKVVRKRSPSHPVMKRGILAPGELKQSSCWSPDECRTILYCINTVMFEKLEFSVNSCFHSAEDILIDKVLANRTGISEIMAIVYSMVAGRLGVLCSPVGFAGFFYLRFLERPYLDDMAAYTFIDVNNKGDFKSLEDVRNCAASFGGHRCVWYDASEPIKILNEMCLHLIGAMPAFEDEDEVLLMRSALDILTVFNSDASPLEFEQITPAHMAFLEGTPTPHYRGVEDNEVKYAVGMIMRHKIRNYRCVIYVWERHCNNIAHDVSRQNKSCLQCKVFYYVLVERGLKRIVNEEELEIDHTNEPISNGEVGKYFESFNGHYYIPNTFKEVEFPEDARARERIFRGSNVEAQRFLMYSDRLCMF